MKLLIITQKIYENDDVLGFFHRWVEEFTKHCEKVYVIAQFVGEYHLPKNVEVFSLGKEKGTSKICQLFNFYKLLFKNIAKIDAVFVHMIPLWVILGGPIFKIYHKKVYLWYVHKSVTLILQLAEKMVDKVFSASPESCRLKSKKIVITGHGIDSTAFQLRSQKSKVPEGQAYGAGKSGKFSIISVGRIAPVKNYEILIEAADILKNKNFNFEIRLAGQPVLEKDKVYSEELKKLIKEKGLEDKIIFIGSVPHKDIAEFYRSGDLFVNFSDTGSIDKTVLEAMASGLLILTSNEAFKNILPEKYFTGKNSQEIAEKILLLSKSEPDPSLRNYVIQNHDLSRLIDKVISSMK